MTELLALRVLVWALPLCLAYLLMMRRRRSHRPVAAVILGLAWNAWSLLAVNLIAVEVGWWTFHRDAPVFMGVAVEPWLGWIVLWGVVAPLVAPDRPAIVTVTGVLWLDLLAMRALHPLIVLGDGWLPGEAAALILAFVPGLLLFRWTLGGSRLASRLALQVVCVGALLLWLVPSVALGLEGGWSGVALRPLWLLAVFVQLIALAAGIGVRAAIEFAERGRGTPLPYDPPVELVTSGPYSYVRNPMQLSMVLIFVMSGTFLGNAWLLVAAGVAFVYSVGLAEWHQDVQLSDRYGESWERYRCAVRSWVPRVRPVLVEDSQLLVAYSCDTCSSLARWFSARKPARLNIAPAEDAGDPQLRRVTYVAPGGESHSGVAAVARALEHIHLGWAFVGWFLALPGVVHLAQWIADAFGPTPHAVAGLAYDPAACSIDASPAE